ncbi:diadenylate cyclase CdaA [bacterium]|nr:diadenylate cyclase CdaA [bacterium]MCP5463290.1 TIGR00159 family protein [bacterium]
MLTFFFASLPIVHTFLQDNWKAVIEITILTLFIYYFVLFIKGTRAVQVMKGLFLLIITFFISKKLDLIVINWLLKMFTPIAILGLVIIFQPELRRGLARLGRSPFFLSLTSDIKIPDMVVDAVQTLSHRKIGAIIVFEREIGLKNYISTGIALDSYITKELLCSIFMPSGPLHDGAVIVEQDRIAAAACLLPLSQYHQISKSLGTRHRAAVGLSEETDALIIVVSEETGTVSIAENGNLIREVEPEKITSLLQAMYQHSK